eukprot:8165403-Pyramimonas_sp.AAC.1
MGRVKQGLLPSMLFDTSSHPLYGASALCFFNRASVIFRRDSRGPVLASRQLSIAPILVFEGLALLLAAHSSQAVNLASVVPNEVQQ